MRFSVDVFKSRLLVPLCTAIVMLNVTQVPCLEPVSFNDDIRPIFADRCFKCHGPDAATQRLELTLRSADLSGFRIATTSSTVAAVRAKLPPERDKQLAYYRQQWPGFQAARKLHERLKEEKTDIEDKAPLTMIAHRIC